ncbi:MAG: 50S ribosomal protein L32 [Thermodesulfobacteriota bacterium]
MPLPKRRHSKARGRKRRTHWKLATPNVTECSHCHQPKLPHRVCPHCGYYNNKEVIPAETAKPAKT